MYRLPKRYAKCPTMMDLLPASLTSPSWILFWQPVLGGFGTVTSPRPLKQWTRVTMHVNEEGQLPSLVTYI
jgi:hypothetical protein